MSRETFIISQKTTIDRVAFEKMVRQTSRLIWAHLMLQCRDAHRSEDLTQETFLRAWKAIASLQDTARLRSWLLAIADRVLLDDHKSSTRLKRGKPSSLETSDVAIDPLPTPAMLSEQSDEQSRVMDAIAELPEHHRQVLMLKYLAQQNNDQICNQLEITDGAMRGLHQRGLEMLRDKLSINQPTLSATRGRSDR